MLWHVPRALPVEHHAAPPTLLPLLPAAAPPLQLPRRAAAAAAPPLAPLHLLVPLGGVGRVGKADPLHLPAAVPAAGSAAGARTPRLLLPRPLLLLLLVQPPGLRGRVAAWPPQPRKHRRPAGRRRRLNLPSSRRGQGAVHRHVLPLRLRCWSAGGGGGRVRRLWLL